MEPRVDARRAIALPGLDEPFRDGETCERGGVAIRTNAPLEGKYMNKKIIAA